MPEVPSTPAATLWRPAWILLALLVVGFDVVKHLLLFFGGPALVELDAEVYWSLGGLIADGDIWLQQVNNAHRTPGYPACIAMFRAMLGDRALYGLIATQHVLCVLTSLLTGWMCWRVTRQAFAAVAGWLLAALCLTRPWFASTVLTETFFTFLLTLHLACAVEYLRWRSRWMVAALGVTLAATLLIRPVMQAWWLPLFVIVLLTQERGRGKQSLGDIVMLAAIVVVLVAPWVLRNQQVFGEPFLTRFVGRELWITTFPPDAGAHLPFPDSSDMRELETLAKAAGGKVDLRHNWTVSRLYAETGLPDDEVDERMRRIAVAAIRQDPGRFAWFTFKRGVNFWRCVVREFPFFGWDGHVHLPGQADWGHEGARQLLSDGLRHVPARFVWFNTLVALAALGGGALLLRSRETRPCGLLLLALLLYVNAVTAVLEIPNIRYRFVLEPAMVIAAICGVATLGRSPGR